MWNLSTSKKIQKARGRKKIAYIVSEYPKISHSFIRREIVALERLGWNIVRFAVRGWSDQLVDEADLIERDLTTYVLKQGIASLFVSVLVIAASRPAKFSQAALLALRMIRRSDRSALLHLIYFIEACWLSWRLLKSEIGHLHAHFGSNPAEVAMLASRICGISFSFTVHGPEEFDKVVGLHIAEKIRQSSFVVAISSFGRSQLYRAVDYLQWPKIKVVHCGIDGVFKGSAPKLATNCNRLVCVGRLSEQKGQALLIAAAAALRDEGLHFELVFVGDGALRQALERLIQVHELGSMVSIFGWADASTVRQEIVSSRALVLPSFAEGLPVVLMEAMALGRPVITTYVAGHPELVVNEQTGWLVPAGSVQELCDAIRSCLTTSDEKIEEMGAIGRTRSLDRHDVDIEAAKLGELFDEALRCVV